MIKDTYQTIIETEGGTKYRLIRWLAHNGRNCTLSAYNEHRPDFDPFNPTSQDNPERYYQ